MGQQEVEEGGIVNRGCTLSPLLHCYILKMVPNVALYKGKDRQKHIIIIMIITSA